MEQTANSIGSIRFPFLRNIWKQNKFSRFNFRTYIYFVVNRNMLNYKYAALSVKTHFLSAFNVMIHDIFTMNVRYILVLRLAHQILASNKSSERIDLFSTSISMIVI